MLKVSFNAFGGSRQHIRPPTVFCLLFYGGWVKHDSKPEQYIDINAENYFIFMRCDCHNIYGMVVGRQRCHMHSSIRSDEFPFEVLHSSAIHSHCCWSAQWTLLILSLCCRFLFRGTISNYVFRLPPNGDDGKCKCVWRECINNKLMERLQSKRPNQIVFTCRADQQWAQEPPPYAILFIWLFEKRCQTARHRSISP